MYSPSDLSEFYDSEDDGWFDEIGEMAEGLRHGLSEAYADASAEDLELAVSDMMEQLSAAEGWGLGSALKSVGNVANAGLSNPIAGQLLSTGLPAAGLALGTVVGGPAGTAVGAHLGGIAAKSLKPKPRRRPVPQRRSFVVPAHRGRPVPRHRRANRKPFNTGSNAAARALMFSQLNPAVLSFLSSSLGDMGRQSINGIPVHRIARMAADLFEEAAQDAEAMYEASASEDHSESYYEEEEDLYRLLMDGESTALAALESYDDEEDVDYEAWDY